MRKNFNTHLILLALLFLLGCKKKEEKNEKPNIVVLLVDDAGYADFGFAGCKDLKTPNIDQLAANGVVFTDAHVSASVCGPSRAGIMTGRYQQRFGFECNPSEPFTGVDLNETTIANAMKQAGYRTAAFGKWHLGEGEAYKPNARGFDYYWGFLAGGRNYFPHKHQDRPNEVHSIRENDTFTTFEGYLTDRLGDKAVDFIDRNKEQPFFMYWAPNAVHSPMQATEADLARFKDHPRQKLAAMTWALDRAVGNIVSKLKKENLLDNTLIFFLSDNGGANNNQSSNLPLKGFKGNKYEGGQRVPFFVHWPKKLKPARYDQLASSLDIFATSVAASQTKVKTNKPLDGVDLIPYITNQKQGAPHTNLFWRKDEMAAMRDGKYKLIRVERLGYRLYDLEKNLAEDNDLTASQPQQFAKMKEQFEKWEQQMMPPLWTEGAVWDSITWMIHQDYYNNRKIRVQDPTQLRRWRANRK